VLSETVMKFSSYRHFRQGTLTKHSREVSNFNQSSLTKFGPLKKVHIRTVGNTGEPNPEHSCQLLYWGWAFESKYDSLPRLDFKGVVCIHITDPPVAWRAYKNKP
jgi:hypothetical protein